MIQELGKGKARFVVNIGSRENRRRVSKTVTYKGKKELKRLYDEFEAEARGTPFLSLTVAELLKAKIDHCRTLNLKADTIRGYQTCEKRLNQPIGTILANKLTTYQLDKMIAEMAQNGSSAKTIKNTIGFLSSAYEYGIKVGIVTDNPCKRASLPKGQPRDIRILYIDEIPSFLDAIAEVELDEKVAYEMALFLGLRRSEILGLKEDDVDIIRGLVNVHETRHRVDGQDITQDTKTKKSTRVLALPDILILDIARLLQTHREFPYEKTDYLVQNGFGQPLSPQALSSRLVRLEADKGLPHVTIHGLRHTYASLLHSQGVDMAMISAELGHSNLSTTMNIYTHRFQDASNASRGIAATINQFNEDRKNVPNLCQIEEMKKP